LYAIHGSLYLLDGTVMRSVYKITVRTDSQTGATGNNITANYNDADAASVVSKATAAYYFNQGVSPASDPIGIYRRVMRRIDLVLDGITNIVSVGPRNYISFQGFSWWIRSRKWDFKAMKTYFTAETGEW
jgi:hypothetical protein